MDFQGLAEQDYNINAATFFKKNKKTTARTCKWNLKFLEENYFLRQSCLLLQVIRRKIVSRVNGVIIVGAVNWQKKLARLFGP